MAGSDIPAKMDEKSHDSTFLGFVSKNVQSFPDGVDISLIQDLLSKCQYVPFKAMLKEDLKKIDSQRSVIMIWMGLFFDQKPGTPAHNFVLKFFINHKDEISEVLFTLIDTVVIKQFLPQYLKYFPNGASNMNESQRSNFFEKASILFANIQILILKLSYQPKDLLTLVFDLIEKVPIPESSISGNFAKKVEFFQKAFELSKVVLKLPNYQIIPDSINQYLGVLSSFFKNPGPLPFSVLMGVSHTAVLLLYKLTPKSTEKDILNRISKLSNNSKSSPKVSSLCLSAYLMESTPEYDIFQSQITTKVRNIVRSWKTTTDSDYIYYTAFLYFNLAKWIRKMDRKVNSVIRRNIKSMLEFAKINWSYRSIEFIFKFTTECLVILSQDDDFDYYVRNELFFSFKSHCPKSIYKFLHIVCEAIGESRFCYLFQGILSERPYVMWLSDFILPSEVPSIEGFEEEDDMVPVNQDNQSNMDFVLFTILRWKVLKIERIPELINLFRFHPKESLFFVNFIMPKLVDIVNSRTFFLADFEVVISQHFPNLDQAICLALLRLNRQKSYNFLGLNERLFIQTLVDRLDPFAEEDFCLQILALLIEHRKMSAPLTEEELRSIFRLFVRCEGFRQAYGRDQLIRLFRKLIWRMTNRTDTDKQRIEMYKSFHQKVWDRCLSDLRLEKYYGTSLVHLEILKLYIELSERIPIVKKHWRRIFLMLQHSFEEIRVAAKDTIIQGYRAKITNFSDVELKLLGECHQEFLKNIQPNLVQSGVILGQLLVTLNQTENDDLFKSHFNTMKKIVKKLGLRVADINSDLMVSTGPSPSYPFLSFIRALITKEMDFALFKTMADERKPKWVDLFQKIINRCMDACKAVSPVVCNDSPEGHLPMEIAQNDDENSDSNLQTTSQKLLYNGWMTVKESVLIISQIVGELADHRLGFVSCTLTRIVIDFLYENQLNLVHRGAFEQSSYGFTRLVRAIWHNGCVKCRERICEILNEIEDRLLDTKPGNNQPGKFVSITRRSAGLPFVVQAILGGDPNFLLFSGFVKSLMEVLDSSLQRYSWQVIHSLNILKSLVQDSRLTKAVDPWIESIFRVTLLWFNTDTYRRCLRGNSNTSIYSIRNSASMLLNALIIRVFGVKRNRADTSRKNRMSSLIFFRNYPSLYSIFVEKLNVSSEKFKTEPFSICPVLIIVSKLTLSISQQNVFDASKFLDLTKQLIYNCPDSRVRQLAVQAYVKLLPYQNYDSVLSELGNNLANLLLNLAMPKSNYLHGFGLLMAEMTKQSMMNYDQTEIRQSIYSLKIIYANLNDFFRPVFMWKIHSTILQSFFKSHYRMRSILQVALHEEECSERTKVCSTCLLKSFFSVSGWESTTSVEFTLDFIIHFIMEDDTSALLSHFERIFFMPISTEAKLASLHLTNELLMFLGSDESALLRRKDLDYPFLDSVREAVWIIRKFSFKKIQKFACFLKLAPRFALEEAARFLKNYHGSSDGDSGQIYLELQADIVSETFRLLYNAKKMKLIQHMTWNGFEDVLYDIVTHIDLEDKHIKRFTIALFSIYLPDKSDLEIFENCDLLFSLIQKLFSGHEIEDRPILLQSTKQYIEWIIESPPLTESQSQLSFLFDLLISFANDEDDSVRKLTFQTMSRLSEKLKIENDGIDRASKMWARLYITVLQRINSKKAPWIFSKQIINRYKDSMLLIFDQNNTNALFEETNQTIDEVVVLEDMIAELSSVIEKSEGKIQKNIVKQILIRGTKFDEELEFAANLGGISLGLGSPQEIHEEEFLDLIKLHFPE